MNDMTLLKVFSERQTHDRYHSYINYEILEPEIVAILSGYSKYFSDFNDKNVVNFEEFQTYFYHYCQPDLTRTQKKLYDQLFKKVKKADAPLASKVLEAYQEKCTLSKLQEVLENPRANISKCQTILEEYDELTSSLNAEAEDGFIVNDISSILEQTDRSGGLQFRLKCLRKSLGGLIRGDFGIVAAYVDTGKSTFAASEATYMAEQITDGCVLWLNNEEFNHRVLKRLWMSTLGKPWDVIVKNRDRAIEAYKKKMHGDINRIKLFDIRGYSLEKIKHLAKTYNPKLIIVDQVDKIDCHVKARWKEHDRLKHLYGV